MLKKKHKIPLDKFIEYCLYDKKNGYYMTKDPFGVNGDFTTSPNISRLFSEMMAIWTISFWKSLGSPKKFNLIELGGGNGEMMRIMIESFKKFPYFLKCCNIIIYEKSPALIEKQKLNINFKNITWKKNFLKINKLPSIFLANEFFDAIPIKQFFKNSNNWYEKLVQKENDKKFNFTKKKIDILKLEKKLKFKISYKQNFIEYSPLGFKYLKNISNTIKKNKGGLLIIDYGYNTKKINNTLKALYKKNYSKVLDNVCKSDITYNINFHLIQKFIDNSDRLNINYTTQRKFLTNLGIFQRAEILSKDKRFSEKADIFYRLKRLTNDSEMGKLFKVMLIKNSENKFQIGFK